MKNMQEWEKQERAIARRVTRANKEAKADGQTLAQKLEKIALRDGLRELLRTHRLMRFEE